MAKFRYVISDLHFGHVALAYKRGFDSVHDHDKALIKNWNRVVPDYGEVAKHDKYIVYILGDVSLHNPKYLAEILPKLNGEKMLVSGNHDDAAANQYYKAVYGATQVQIHGDMYIMTHIPIHPQELFGRWKGNIHGHLHHNFVYEDWQNVLGNVTGTIKDDRYINVSAEQLSLTPQPLESLVGRRPLTATEVES